MLPISAPSPMIKSILHLVTASHPCVGLTPTSGNTEGLFPNTTLAVELDVKPNLTFAGIKGNCSI